VSKKLFYNKWVLRFQNNADFFLIFYVFFNLKYTPDSYYPSHTVLYPHVRGLTKNLVITNSVITNSRFCGPFEFVITWFYCNVCWQQRMGWVREGSGGKAGTSPCLHTLPLPSLGNATNTNKFTKKSQDFVWLITYGHHCTSPLRKCMVGSINH